MVQPKRAHTSHSAVLLQQDIGPIAVLTLNRPAARNCLSEDLIRELHAALDAAAKNPDIRGVVITANGTAFSSGHDLKELTAHRADQDGGRAYFAHLMSLCSNLMQAVVALPKPVIAAVQGIATAAGCQLVASCDLAVASDRASFATPGVDIGLFCSTPMVALTRNVPRKQAMEMLLTGEPISAARAREIGLVNRVVPAGTEFEAAMSLARQISQKSAYTISLGKAAFHQQAEMGLADAYRLASEVMTKNMMAADAEEGIGAFIAKRIPVWQDR